MTPEQIAELLRSTAEDIHGHPLAGDFRAAAHAVESITAERDALAEQLKQMREALDRCTQGYRNLIELRSSRDGSIFVWVKEVEEILAEVEKPCALTPTDAEAAARENAKKAALLHWLFDLDRDGRSRIRGVLNHWNGEENFIEFAQKQKEASDAPAN